MCGGIRSGLARQVSEADLATATYYGTDENGESESGTERNALQILQVSGLASPITETVNLTYIEAAEKLKSGEIDAKTVDKLKLAYSSYEACEIPANTYNGQTEKVATVGVKALLLASEKMSDKTAEELTKQLFAHATEIQYATSLKEIFDANAAVDGVQIPFHPGAKAYYASQGITVDAQEN